MLVMGLSGTALAGPQEDYERAGQAYRSGDFATAMKIAKSLAEQGHADAQYNLGVMYRDGQGVKKDDTQAVYWFQ